MIGYQYKFQENYYCEQKDDSGEITASTKISLRNFNVVSKTLSLTKDAKKYFFVEQPSQDKKFAIYDEGKLKWFDLIDHDLYFDTLELSDNKVKHKNFSMELEAEDYKRFNKLYKKAEKAKKDHDAELLSVKSYATEEEMFFYASNAFFRKGMKDTNNFLVLFDGDCK